MRLPFTAIVVLGLFAGITFAQPAPKKADEKQLVTKVHNIKPLLGKRGKAAGIADADAVVKLILETIPLGKTEPNTAGPQLTELDGGKLEVRATEKVQEEIKDLLAALTRLQDVAVDVKAELIELDAMTYEKLLKPWMKPTDRQPGSPVLVFDSPNGERLTDKVLRVFPDPNAKPPLTPRLTDLERMIKAGRVVQKSGDRFVNGLEATISARRVVVPYTTVPGAVAIGGKVANSPFVKEGFGLVAVPIVSADRRFIRFKLTEQSTLISGIQKRELGELNGKPIVAQSPIVEDLGATGSAVVVDGGTLIFKLAYAPKDKVWIVVLKPTIFIQEEADELKKQQGKP